MHGHQLVNQMIAVDAVSVATLSGRTALTLNTLFGGINTTFLLKRIRYFLQATSLTANDDGPLVVGVAQGDAASSEITAAMVEFNNDGPTDVGQTLTEDDAWVVYQNSIAPLIRTGSGLVAQTPSDWISFGGKNGIPALEGNGFKTFVFNCGSGENATGTINGIAQIQGVWLRD